MLSAKWQPFCLSLNVFKQRHGQHIPKNLYTIWTCCKESSFGTTHFTHIFQDCFTGTRVELWLTQCQWSTLNQMGKYITWIHEELLIDPWWNKQSTRIHSLYSFILNVEQASSMMKWQLGPLWQSSCISSSLVIEMPKCSSTDRGVLISLKQKGLMSRDTVYLYTLKTLWWHHHMTTLSSLLALCEGNPLVTNEFPS